MPMQQGTVQLIGLDDEEKLAAVTARIEALDGVESVVIETKEGAAHVAYDDAKVSMADILARVEQAGFDISAGED